MSNSRIFSKQVTELTSLLASLHSKEEVLKFLKAILTVEEFENIVQRLQIVKMLKQGKPQREIAEKLGVGIATVTRGSKEIKNGNFKEVT